MLTVKFSKSYDDVLTQAYLFQSGLIRDLSLFTAYSPIFDSDYASDFLDLIEAAGAIPTNEEDLNNQVILSNDAESKMEESRLLYRKLISYVRVKWGNSDSVLRAFGNNLYEKARRSPQSMINLLELANRAAESSKYKTDLIAVGFVQLDITALLTLSVELKEIYNNQQEFMQLSSDRAEERVIAFNKVWDLMVQINYASKQVFIDSPALTEYYLLYPEGPGPGPITAPANLRYNTQYLKVEWDAVANATSYQLDVSTDGVNFSELVTTSDPEFSYIPYDAHTFFRVRSRNANGFSDYSNIIDFWYYEPLPAPANFVAELIPGHQYKLSWDLVHSVTSYKIYISDVPFGEPESVFAPLYETSALEYTGAITAGRRYYFKITSNNNYEPESAYSSTEFVEVTGV